MQGYIGARSQSTLSVRLGESSTAYSSPSKEISTINGHLSGRMHPQQLASSGLPASMVLQRLDPNVVRCCAVLSWLHMCARPVLRTLLCGFPAPSLAGKLIGPRGKLRTAWPLLEGQMGYFI